MTMTHIQTIPVGSGGVASITFSDIPDSYTDLVILLSFRSAAGGSSAGKITFNTSGGTYTRRRLGGDGSSAFSDTPAFDYTINDSARTANTFSNGYIYIPNYRSSVAKSYSTDSVNENNATGAVQTLYAGLWSGTDPITSITLQDQAVANLVEFSSASLYGISKFDGGSSPKASGGIVTYDSVNDKWVHTFTSTGTFTPTENLSGVEYLVVAGGGGGGASIATQGGGGGGGAGGYRSSVVGESSGGGASAESTLSLTASTNYSVLVGAGGSVGVGTSGTNGSSSTFHTITATGGGGGGRGTAGTSGLTGGSGGGGGYGDSGGGAGGSGTANQGYGGQGGNVGPLSVGGGGGGGAAESGGTDGATYGGDGVSSAITGTSVTRAGGGGGGVYSSSLDNSGAGGAGRGVNANGGPGSTAGQSGTGSGGGGGYSTSVASAGGSGIVIVRYSA